MSAIPFLITGLPRSRTAWMAAFMSTGKVLCRHEAIKTLSDISEVGTLFESECHTHIGLSDSTAGFFLPQIMEFIRPKCVIIIRNQLEVKESMRKLGLPMDVQIDELCFDLSSFRQHPDVLTVGFDRLDNIIAMRKIWFHLVPGVPFDEERFKQFNNLHIEADVGDVNKYVVNNNFRCLNLMRDVICRAKEKSCRS